MRMLGKAPSGFPQRIEAPEFPLETVDSPELTGSGSFP